MTPDDFKAWRKALNLTQEAAAVALGVSRQSVGNYERGSRLEDGRPVEIPRSVELACLSIRARLDRYPPNGTAIRHIGNMGFLNGRGIPQAWWDNHWITFKSRFETSLVVPDPSFETEELAILNRYCDEAGMMTREQLEDERVTD